MFTLTFLPVGLILRCIAKLSRLISFYEVHVHVPPENVGNRALLNHLKIPKHLLRKGGGLAQ